MENLDLRKYFNSFSQYSAESFGDKECKHVLKATYNRRPKEIEEESDRRMSHMFYISFS